jgi:hypothetical protein
MATAVVCVAPWVPIRADRASTSDASNQSRCSQPRSAGFGQYSPRAVSNNCGRVTALVVSDTLTAEFPVVVRTHQPSIR